MVPTFELNIVCLSQTSYLSLGKALSSFQPFIATLADEFNVGSRRQTS